MPRGIKIDVTDVDLRNAIEVSTSWRGVLRHLGYATTNGHLSASLKARADSAGISAGHFRGKRSWSDADLQAAVANSTCWTDVAVQLGLVVGSGMARVKARAMQIEIDTAHFVGASRDRQAGEPIFTDPPGPLHLSRAAPSMAAAWFARRGYTVSLPLEPCSYDMIVDDHGMLLRVQVKSTRTRMGKGWVCRLMNKTSFVKREPYPESVDVFFLVDGDLGMYVVPVARLAGTGSVQLPLPSYAVTP